MTAPVTQQREQVAMTAPVLQSPADERRNADAWRVRFFMPSKNDLESRPQPAAGSVRLMPIAATRRATIRFSGIAADTLIAEKESALRGWLAKRGTTSAGLPTYAYYNAPFTPGPMRRNEVWLAIAN